MSIKPPFRTLVRAALPLAAAAVLAACATGSGAGRSAANPDPAVLEDLVEERWEHLLAGRFDQAWDYFSPGYKQVKPRAEYASEMKNRPVTWLSARYVSRDCPTAERCRVKVDIGFRIRMAVTGVGEVEASRVVTERWIFLDGQWVYLPPEAVR